ncbi:t-SNARE [Xylaria bambusicola]|uniref:t-SNARE n=1 Tax=Xylaria bambusicola TaxID=326684 RepID=UPI0020078139|nr:t-SNARE [Xylaria bambusicola]KAI0513045.1 t-SNARE [Xylaria bambusicola]
MAPLAQNVDPFQDRSPNSALDEISDINRGIDTIDRNLEQLKMLQQRSLDDADSSASSNTNRQLDRLSSETMAQYRSLTERVRQLKSKPENTQRFGQQVRRVDGRLKDAIRAYQQVESAFRKKTEEQMARQYRIVRPDATEEEVRAAVTDQTGGQVFQQALMQSNRMGQAQSVLNAVQDRHAQLQKIERQMIELAQLFQDMDTLVMQQDVAVTNIEQKGEEVVDNLDRGNVEIGTAVNTARATRKKKWICLGISVLILVILAAILAGYFVTHPPGGGNNNNNNKRSLDEILGIRSIIESESTPQLLTSRINAESRRWLTSTTT